MKFNIKGFIPTDKVKIPYMDNSKLSFIAKGLMFCLIYKASKDPVITIEDFLNFSSDDISVTNTAFEELIKYGYIVEDSVDDFSLIGERFLLEMSNDF